MGEGASESWAEVGTQVRERLAQWHAEHPAATLEEIEAAVETQLGALRVHLLQERVASTAATLTAATEPRPACPHCTAPMQARGKRPRTLTVRGDQVLQFTRPYYVCPTCQVGLSPPR